MKTFSNQQFINEAKVLDTAAINLQHVGPTKSGIRVQFDVKKVRRTTGEFWAMLHIRATEKGKPYAGKDYRITDKTKKEDVYKWAKEVSKVDMPKNREIDNIFKKSISVAEKIASGK
jgi:hypothetical protein